MSWLVIAFVVPLLVAWQDGTSYAFAFSVSAAGVVMYFVNIALIHYYISRRAPETLADDSWELTAGTGIVPRWVSVIGLVGMGFAPSGLLVALLLYLGVFVDRG